MVRAIARLDEIRLLGLNSLPTSKVPINRISTFARYTSTIKAQAISRMNDERRIAALYAFGRMLEAAAHDDALDIFDYFINEIFTKAEYANKKQRLRTIKDLDKAAIIVRNACGIMLKQAEPYHDLSEIGIDSKVLFTAMTTIDNLTRPPDDCYYPELQAQYRSLRRYLPHVLTSIQLSGTQGAKPVLHAIEFLKSLELDHKRSMSSAPLEIINNPWKRYVFSENAIADRQAYTFCFLDRFRDALNCREVFVPASSRYANPRIGMFEGEAWNSSRIQVCRVLGRDPNHEKELEALTKSYRRTALNFSNNPYGRIEKIKGKDELIITPLEKLDETVSCTELRKTLRD